MKIHTHYTTRIIVYYRGALFGDPDACQSVSMDLAVNVLTLFVCQIILFKLCLANSSITVAVVQVSFVIALCSIRSYRTPFACTVRTRTKCCNDERAEYR